MFTFFPLGLCLMVSKIGPSGEADAEKRFGAQGIHFFKRKGKKAEKHQSHQITRLSQQEALDEKWPCPGHLGGVILGKMTPRSEGRLWHPACWRLSANWTQSSWADSPTFHTSFTPSRSEVFFLTTCLLTSGTLYKGSSLMPGPWYSPMALFSSVF